MRCNNFLQFKRFLILVHEAWKQIFAANVWRICHWLAPVSNPYSFQIVKLSANHAAEWMCEDLVLVLRMRTAGGFWRTKESLLSWEENFSLIQSKVNNTFGNCYFIFLQKISYRVRLHVVHSSRAPLPRNSTSSCLSWHCANLTIFL